MLNLVLSTITFFAAAHLTKRYFDRAELPKGRTRSLLVFAIALAVSFGVAAIVDWLVA